jgi:superfamily II DNA helicase RecQ
VFNGVSSEDVKRSILRKFSGPHSEIRVLIATVSFGMVMDVPDIRRCILFGATMSALDAIQKIGRAGRDGFPAEAIIFPFRPPYAIQKGDCCIFNSECHRQQLLSQTYMCQKLKTVCVVHAPVCRSYQCTCTQCVCCSNCSKLCPCLKHLKNGNKAPA